MTRLGSAVFAVAILAGCQNPPPSTGAPLSDAGLPRVSDAGLLTVATAAPAATSCSRPTPSLAPALVFQNGNLDLNAPFRLGFVQFIVVPCREIDPIRQKYGLGSAARVITEPSDPKSDPDDIRSRYYIVDVPVGAEAAFVRRLAAHPEDFQYVEFAFISGGCIPEGPPLGPPCFVRSMVEPNEGPAGISFNMQICCFPEGAAVSKTFTLPSGRTIVVADRAAQDRTVRAAWGGSPSDERGMYSVTVTDGEIGSLVRFRIR